MKSFLKNNWLTCIAIVMLLGVALSYFQMLFALPCVFYQLMNWIVAGAALLIVWKAYKKAKLWLVWIFILIAVVFNPVAELYVSSLVWLIADIVVMILFIASFFLIREKKN